MKICMPDRVAVVCLVFLAGCILTFAAPAENARVLLGSWTGKATGPQGGPPTGDITVTFEKDPPGGIKGTIIVKAQGGGMQYSGQISNVLLKSKVFSATAVFKLGENPLEVRVIGPLRGRTIEGSFSVISKGQKMGEGIFSMTKEHVPKSPKKP